MLVLLQVWGSIGESQSVNLLEQNVFNLGPVTCGGSCFCAQL